MRKKIKLGDVYESNWGANVVRIIGFDEHEVFYDLLWRHSNSWAFSSNIHKKCYFYRSDIKSFLKKSKRVDYIKLSNTESAIFRPDLAVRTCRIESISWTDKNLADSKFISQNYDLAGMKDINAAKIWLYPFKCDNSFSCAKLVEASNGKSFSAVELINKAYAIQNSANPKATDGIGIYRIGIQNGVPSYYIGEFYDIAGIMKEEEDLNNRFNDFDSRELVWA